MVIKVNIKPEVPPEIAANPNSFAVAGSPNSVRLLDNLGITEGMLIMWQAPEHLLNSAPKSQSIFIPFLEKSGEIILIKNVCALNVELLGNQIHQQLNELETFIISLKITNQKLGVQLLLVLDKKCQRDSVNEIQELKNLVLKSSSNFHCITVAVNAIANKAEKDTFTKDEKKFFNSILLTCMAQASKDELDRESNPIIQALIDSTPQFNYLKLSTNVYNNSSFEDKQGIDLRNVKKVKEIYSKFFAPSSDKIMFLPDLDLMGHQILDSTKPDDGASILKDFDGFLGEYVNFTECLLSRLTDPKGLLIRGYSQKQLNAVLNENFSLNFEFDWILCANDEITVFEVGRSDNVSTPSSTVSRKLTQIFSKLLPKFQYFVVSFLKSIEMESKLVENFLQNHLQFIAYFPNISDDKIRNFLMGLNKEDKENLQFRIVNETLNSMPRNITSQVLIMVDGDGEKSQKQLPILYHLQPVDNGTGWTLVPSSITANDIFRCKNSSQTSSDISGISIGDCRPVHEVHYISGLLTCGFLIQSFRQAEDSQPLPSWDLKVKAKTSRKGDYLSKLHPDLILSPQQKRILEENRKFLMLLGEPGCGKTSLLLARALNAAEDPNVETVFFSIPKTKIAMKIWLEKFASSSTSMDFKKKWKLADLEMFKNGFDASELRKSVLFVDELYLTSSQTYSEKDKKIMVSSRIAEMIPLVKQCWIAKTEAGQEDKKLLTLATLPHFQTECLNVLFRSSWHIGSFTSRLLHKKKIFTQSSARTFGCTEASQYKVEVESYVDIGDCLHKITKCFNLRSKFNAERVAIVYTKSERMNSWEDALSNIGNIVRDYFIVNDEMNYYDIPFTGIEMASVLLVVDYVTTKADDDKLILSLILLAASRAQFELHISMQKSYDTEMNLISDLCRINSNDLTLVAARMGLPLELDQLLPEKLENADIKLGNELFAIAVMREDTKLLDAVIKFFPVVKIDLKQFFVLMGPSKKAKTMSLLTDYLGPKMASVFRFHSKTMPFQRLLGTEALTGALRGNSMASWVDMDNALNVGVRFSATKTLDWIEDVIGTCSMAALVKNSGFVLYSACMNGSYQVIKWAVTTLEKYNCLQKELNKIYDSWDSWNRMQFTLLFFLCYMNMEDVKPITLFQEKGFSQNLLCCKFGGRDALEISVYHNNLKTVKALLKNPRWVREFLPMEKGVEKILKSSQSKEVQDFVERRFCEAWEVKSRNYNIHSKRRNPRT